LYGTADNEIILTFIILLAPLSAIYKADRKQKEAKALFFSAKIKFNIRKTSNLIDYTIHFW